MRFSKWIVSAIVVMNALFTIAVLYIFLRIGQEPAVLIGAWFAFTTGELWALSKITREKNKKNKESEENNS